MRYETASDCISVALESASCYTSGWEGMARMARMAQLALYVFGAPRIERDGAQAQVDTRKARHAGRAALARLWAVAGAGDAAPHAFRPQ